MATGRERQGRATRIGRLARYGSWGGGGAAIAVALLMAFSQGAGAVTPHVHVYAAPYTHTKALTYKSVSTSGTCPATAKLSGWAWAPTTGFITGSASGSAKACSNAPLGNGNAYGSAYGEETVAFPVAVTTGSHNFTVNTAYHITITAAGTGTWMCKAATNSPGHYTYNSCSWYVDAYTSWNFELFDATNQTYLYGSHAGVSGPENYTDFYADSSCNGLGNCTWYNSSYGCSNLYYYSDCVPSGTTASGTNASWLNTGANCGYSYAGHCYSWQNWTLNHTHHYYIVLYVYASAYGSTYNYPAGNVAMASVNGATLGNTGWKVSSIVVA
jgi:hypothetical protein